MSQDPVIRPIRPEDNPAVAAIIRAVMTEFGAVGPGYSINDPEVDTMFEAYDRPGAAFWVIEREGRVEGCAGIAPLKGGEADTCELQKMYFIPGLRGLGLGARLMDLCLREAAAAGYRQCYLETLASMSGARRLYRGYGFTDIDQAMGATGHCGCDRWMVRELSTGD